MAGLRPWLAIVGIGEDGVEGLAPAASRAVSEASVVFGGDRHLTLGASLIRGDIFPWLSPLEDTIPLVLARRGQPTCILATGDPYHYGIGATLARFVERGEVVAFPQPSAFSLAASRLGWAIQEACCLSLHGRALGRVIPSLQAGARILALSWDGTTPGKLAVLLAQHGFGASVLHICEALGGPRERVRSRAAAAFDLEDVSDLNTIGLEVNSGLGARSRPCTSGLPDDWFEQDGQITKSPVRAVTLAALSPYPGQCLWDIGAGSGSVSIEWLLSHPAMRAVAVERQGERAARIVRNAGVWGVSDRLTMVEGEATALLGDLPPPNAIFVGGGATAPGLLDRCCTALPSAGRLVVNAVTLETQALLIDALRQRGGELLTLAIAQAEPVGGFHGLRPSMPVMQWRWRKL